MAADVLLSKLEGVKRTGDGRWIAKCPSHRDRSPSLSIRELDDGRTLVHCFAGCGVEAVLGAIGLDFEDLFLPRQTERGKPERRPFLPSDVFDIARREIAVAAIVACDLHKKREVSESDYQRLLTAAERLEGIARAAYGR
jgi:hypothetical protein